MMHRLMPLLAVFVAVLRWPCPLRIQPQPLPTPRAKSLLLNSHPIARSQPAVPPPARGTAAPPGVIARAYNWLLTQQQRLNRELANAVKELKAAGSITAALVLGFIGFSYGVLHAAGPGHGKAIISSTFWQTRKPFAAASCCRFSPPSYKRSRRLCSSASSPSRSNATSMEMRVAEGWIETISWAFVTAVGAWLLYGQIRQILARRQVTPHTGLPSVGKIKTHTHARTSVPASGRLMPTPMIRPMITSTRMAAAMITAIRISPTHMTTMTAAAMPTCPIQKICKAI